MNILVLVFLLLYALIPVCIFFSCFQTTNRKIRACRLRYAIPAMLLTVGNVGAFYYHWFVNALPFFEPHDMTFLIPPLLLLLVLIIWNARKRQEKVIQAEITEKEIENVRFRKGSGARQAITISSEDESEML